MHRGHDHQHFGGSGGPHGHPHADIGHNGSPRPSAQWQTPHLSPEETARIEQRPAEPDIDLVEASFVESFTTASDPTSFLRLARVAFEGTAPDGAHLALLRVEMDKVADVGSLSPRLHGTFGYNPLPAQLVSRRTRLRFIYFDGNATRALNLSEAVALGALAAGSADV
jgi:hypothetical protein